MDYFLKFVSMGGLKAPQFPKLGESDFERDWRPSGNHIEEEEQDINITNSIPSSTKIWQSSPHQ